MSAYVSVFVLYKDFYFQIKNIHINQENTNSQRRSRSAAASKMKHFVIIVNGFQPLTYHKVLHIECCSSPRPPPKLLKLQLITKHYSFIDLVQNDFPAF